MSHLVGPQTWEVLKLSTKYAKLGARGPSFVKTGDEIKSQTGPINWFSLVLQEFQPNFGFAFAYNTFTADHILHYYIKSYHNKILQILWIDTQFH